MITVGTTLQGTQGKLTFSSIWRLQNEVDCLFDL